MIIDDAVYDEFRDGMIEKIKAAKVGDPMDRSVAVGPLAIQHLTEELRVQVRDSVKQGCKLSYGSLDVPEELQHHNGNFFSPVILENITPAARAYSEELFGPVLALYRVQSEDAAIELANTSSYGLGAAVFSKDTERATGIARRLDSGMLYINDFV